MKLVEILKDFKHESEDYFIGEVIKVEDSIADFWCRAGWVRDTTGITPTGSPKPEDIITLDIQNLTQSNLTEVV